MDPIMDLLDRMYEIRQLGTPLLGSDGKVRRWRKVLGKGRTVEPYSVSIITDAGHKEALFIFASDRDATKARWILVEERGKCWMRYPIKGTANDYQVMSCVGGYGPNKYVGATQDILKELSQETSPGIISA